MSKSANFQDAMIELLGMPGAVRTTLPLIARRPKSLESDIQAAWALSGGLCAHVLPVLPIKVQDSDPFVFVAEGELRLRICEKPALTGSGVNAWQIADDICNAGQWAPKTTGTKLGALLAHPLQLAPNCVETVSDATTRIVDVIFNATYQLSGGPAAAVPFTGEYPSIAEALQAALKAQLDGTLSTPIPTLLKRDHDLASQIETAGNPVKIEILPPMPARAMQGVPFVFFEGYQVRCKVTEYPATNAGPDAYDIVEEIMTALHWQQFGGFLAHPLQLASNPTQFNDQLDRREIDVIFNATVGLQPPAE